ncbi:DUF4838 domain-containing protein [Horticoccus luteus]|uniref:DUF4838 domain-containing protein n=1 Tax=Horticoccus luteus TaxID=2862869 RepID=A0A8F9TUY6_9BACT|nr:DUF4838 domain-containing protein [Horticoccus luteus]QYM78552.1 DUF4838 domain-containing protein [Horticoccus luteus]
MGLVALAWCGAAFGRPLTVVKAGEPPALVVLPAQPNEVSRYAAEELVYHIRRATGVTLTVVREGREMPAGGARLYVGDTQAARGAGIDVQQLAREAFAFRAVADGFVIAGSDEGGEALDVSVAAGTLFGVYEWLEEVVQVRWLWPGELGTFVPIHATVVADVPDAIRAPHFVQRQVRGGLTFKSEHPTMGFSPGALEDYAHAQAVYLRRHRMGRAKNLTYRHAFTDWWEKYGAEHPEWFQLVNGKRGPTAPGRSYSMCVSNPEFQHKIVELWRERRAKDGSAASHYLNAVENGIMGLCECDNCRALDGPQPDDFLDYYARTSKMMGSHCVTDRYAKFWLAVQAEARKTDPDVTLVVYNYFNYYYFPSAAITLNDHILVGSYPSSGWYPRSPEENEWFRRQWQGWARTGAKLFSRGNYCLDGYNMPYVYAHQFADEFKFQVSTGMVATDYDALTGQWSTQGPNIYLLMRLQTRPDEDADRLLEEYYGAFGAAAAEVRAYFNYWEAYVVTQREHTSAVFDDMKASRWRSWAKVAHEVFPAASFTPAERLLAAAAAAVKDDAEAAQRVEFLRLGLVQAKLCSRVAGLLTLADPHATPERGAAALAELAAFRHAHEREWIGNFNHSAWIEDASWVWPAAKSNQSN